MISSPLRTKCRTWNDSIRVFAGWPALLFTFLSLPVLAQEKGPPLRPLPSLRLEGLEIAVQEQLRAVRDELQAIRTDPAATKSQLAEAYGGLGQLLHAYVMFDAAEDCYYNARELAPGEFRWNYYLGVVLERQGHWNEASEALLAALSIRPESIPVLVRLGESFLQIGDLQRAEEYYSKAVSLESSAAAAHFGLGQVKILERKYAAAVDHLEAALAHAPQANLIHYSLGMAYRGAGDMENAQRHLSRRGSVGVGPADPLIDELHQLAAGEIVANLRGHRAFNARRYQDAVNEFRRAVTAAPESSRARTNLAASLAEVGRMDEAMVEFRNAIELNPAGAETARFNLARLLMYAGRAAEAIPLLQFVVSRRPSDRSARLELARAWGLAGDFDSALEVLKPAIVAQSSDAESALLEVDLLMQMGREKTARERLETLREKLPHDLRVLQRLVRLLTAASDPEVREPALSLELARQAFEASPTLENAEAIFFVHLALGDCPAAHGWLSDVLDRDPPAAVRSRLQKLLLALQQHPRCREPEQQ
ncbi:MAG TPA: tetratricopeptide repeat protein [Acidobacteriota bacterium]|nr:tetratricopeptide repeat protein [Acidobacteriota bacterium]